MSTSNYTKIFTGDSFLVQRIVADLEAVNIIPVIKDETESGRLAGFSVSIYGEKDVYVNNEELEGATKIMDKLMSELGL
ncbi:MAG: putative signal transducing protein [Flavobacteriaceae bacterium]